MLRLEAFTEKRCLAIIFLMFLFVSIVAKSFPHSFEHATIPDERVFYTWAKFYDSGKIVVPIQDWPYERPVELSFFVGEKNETLVVNARLGDSLEIFVKNADGLAIENASVLLKKEMLINFTDENGKCIFENLPKSRAYEIEVKKDFGNITAVVNTVVFGQGNTGTYSWYLSIHSKDGKTMARLFDTFNNSIKDADLFLDDTRLGATDQNGELEFTAQKGNHKLSAQKKSDFDAMGGVPVCIDGKYYIVSEKAPGYSLFLVPFIHFGLGELVSVILLGLGTFSIYFLAKRLFNRFSASIASLLFVTNSIVVQNVFTTGMSDLCSTVLAIFGIFLFLENLLGNKSVFYSIAGGLVLGCSVAVRYSSVLIVFAPFLFMLAIVFQSKPYLPKFKKTIKHAIPFLIGLLIVGSAIAYYNYTLFGNVFSSGYSQGQLKIEDENSTASIEDKNYLGNFDIGSGISTWPNKLFFFLMLAPFVYLAPGGILWGRKKPEFYLLFIWMCSVFFLYMNVAWVASWPDLARSIEDMRYFLPGIPAAALLASINIKRIFERKKILAFALVTIFIISGIGFGIFGITTQLNRQKMVPPPGTHIEKVTVAQLLASPLKYEDKIVVISNVSVIWTDGKIAKIKDSTSERNLNLVLLMLDRPPSLLVGDTIDVSGIFKRSKSNQDGSIDGEWDVIAKSISVKKTKSSYTLVHIEEIISNPDKYANSTIRIENIQVETIINQHVFRASNVVIHIDLGLVPQVGTFINVQGFFVLNQFGEYEIHVRQNTSDSIEIR
jgi:hypothetical protein